MVLFNDLFFAARFMSYLFDHNIFIIGMPWSLILTTAHILLFKVVHKTSNNQMKKKEMLFENCVCSSNCKINTQQNC